METGSGDHTSSYTMGTGSSTPGVKRHGRKADHSSPVSTEFKEKWIYTSTPPHTLIIKHRDKFTFTQYTAVMRNKALPQLPVLKELKTMWSCRTTPLSVIHTEGTTEFH
jgi:hypothetical protein